MNLAPWDLRLLGNLKTLHDLGHDAVETPAPSAWQPLVAAGLVAIGISHRAGRSTVLVALTPEGLAALADEGEDPPS